LGVGIVEKNSPTIFPPLFRGHLLDTLAPLVFAGWQRFSVGTFEPEYETKEAFGILVFSEITQLTFPGVWRALSNLIGKEPSFRFDPLDFVAFWIGKRLNILYERSAKWLYDSGVTIPIYQVLGIEDSRSLEP